MHEHGQHRKWQQGVLNYKGKVLCQLM